MRGRRIGLRRAGLRSRPGSRQPRLEALEERQLLATFILNAEDNQRFGAQDAQIIGTLEWGEGSESSTAK